MKDYITRLLLLACSLLLIACSSEEDEFGKVETFVYQSTLEFGPVLQQCMHLWISRCFQGTTADGNLTLFTYFATDDFQYEWGYNYRLRIEETIVTDPRMSKPSITIRLLEPYQKTPADLSAPFEVSLISLDFHFLKEDERYSLFDKELVCLSDSDCILLEELQEQEEMSVRLEVMVSEQSDAPLTLVKILCFEPSEVYFNNPAEASCVYGNFRNED